MIFLPNISPSWVKYLSINGSTQNQLKILHENTIDIEFDAYQFIIGNYCIWLENKQI